MKISNALALIALCTVFTGAAAQNNPKPTALATCPADAQDLPMEALYGQWAARFDGLPTDFVVQLDKHPDYAGVKGTITRGAATAQLAGDIDDEGQLTIDESQDGLRISGIWLGALEAGSCGKTFSGTWRNAIDDSMHPFVLNKTGTLR
jgi:hypothetical protein